MSLILSQLQVKEAEFVQALHETCQCCHNLQCLLHSVDVIDYFMCICHSFSPKDRLDLVVACESVEAELVNSLFRSFGCGSPICL